MIELFLHILVVVSVLNVLCHICYELVWQLQVLHGAVGGIQLLLEVCHLLRELLKDDGNRSKHVGVD